MNWKKGLSDLFSVQMHIRYIYVTECIVYMFRAIPFNLFFPVLFLFDWVGFLWPNYLRC